MLSRDPGVFPEVYSVSSRLLLSSFLRISRLPPSLVSKDLTFQSELSFKLQNACIELASAKSVALGRTLPLLTNLVDQSVNTHRGCALEGYLTVFSSRLPKPLVFWTFCYIRGCPRRYGRYHPWRTFHCSELRRVRRRRNYGQCLDWLHTRILNLRYRINYRHSHRQRNQKVLLSWWNRPLRFVRFPVILRFLRDHLLSRQAICKSIKRIFRPSLLHPKTRPKLQTILPPRTNCLPGSSSARNHPRCLNLPNLPLGIRSVSSATKTKRRKKRYRVSIWIRIRIRGHSDARTLVFRHSFSSLQDLSITLP